MRGFEILVKMYQVNIDDEGFFKFVLIWVTKVLGLSESTVALSAPY